LSLVLLWLTEEVSSLILLSHNFEAIQLLKVVELLLEYEHRNLGHSDISSVETVKAVSSENSTLHPVSLTIETVLCKERELVKKLFYLLHQIVQSLKVVAFGL